MRRLVTAEGAVPVGEEVFGEDYYERGEELGISGYTDYHWMPEATLALAHELVVQLGIKRSDTILDFGCAKGFLVRSFRLLHYDASGVDVSHYAIEMSPLDVKPHVDVIEPGAPLRRKYDWILAKDVLEHIDRWDLPTILKNLRAACRSLFVVVPLGDGKKYIVPEYEGDVTHKIRETLEWWSGAFEVVGFRVESAHYRMPWVKEKWAKYERGNGFFVLR